jgi:regulator of replication initiation timing
MIPEIRQARIMLSNLEQQLEDLITNTQKIQMENVDLKNRIMILNNEIQELKNKNVNENDRHNKDTEEPEQEISKIST